MRKLIGSAILVCGLALAAACSSSSSNGSVGDTNDASDKDDSPSSSDASKDSGSDSPTACDYPADAGNDPRCPAAYSFDYEDTLCSQVGLHCEYPGRGDGTADGCYSTAVLFCNAADAGISGIDAAIFDGADAGSGFWTAAQ